MRRILIILGVLAALWSGLWLAGRAAVEGAVSGAFEQAARDGQVAGYRMMSLDGFPGRLSLSLKGVTWATPEGAALQVDALRVSAPAYYPLHLSARTEGSQHLSLPDEDLTLTPARLRAGLRLAPVPGLDVERLTLDGTRLALASTAPWRATLGAVTLRLLRGESPLAYRLTLDAQDAAPGPGLRAALDPTRRMPARIGPLSVKAALTLSAPLGLAGRTPPARITRLAIEAANLDWGDVRLAAEGRLTVAPQGWPEGTVTLTIRHWRKALAWAEAAGLLPPENAPALKSALKGLSEAAPDPDQVALPILFSGGWMRFGFLTLGPAPRLAPPAP